MGWELPDDLNPPDTVCVQLQVPNDPKYIAAFWGAILDLSAGFNWANDAGHNAILAARRMRLMYLAAQLGDCSQPCTPIVPGFTLDDCMNIRQDPDNPCLLREVCPDGSLGCVIYDGSLCRPSPQPGAPQPQPPPGGCLSYDISLWASQMALVPVLLNAGDTIELLSASGATADGGTDWFCPTGNYFIAGACVGTVVLEGTDPVPTAGHMSVLANIGGTLTPLPIGTPVTVPGGVSNAQPVLQVNDSTLSDDSGNLTLKVKVCNNASPVAPEWCYKFDFTVSDGGFVTASGYGGAYVGGTGWTAPVGFLGLLKTFPIAAETSSIFVSGVFNFPLGQIGYNYANPPGGLLSTEYSGPVNTTFVPVNTVPGALFFIGSDGTHGTVLTSVTLAGFGPNPFGADNCF